MDGNVRVRRKMSAFSRLREKVAEGRMREARFDGCMKERTKKRPSVRSLIKS